MAQPRIVHNNDTREYYFEAHCHMTEWRNSIDDEDLCTPRFMPEVYEDIAP